MKFKPTLTTEQKQSLYGIIYAGFQDYHRETQHGHPMSDIEVNKATQISRQLVTVVDFVISPEVKE